MHREWWRPTSGEKEELFKCGVDKQRWQQEDKCSMHAGSMNNTRRSHDMCQRLRDTRDPTMFGAASDTAVGRVVEFKAVIQNYSMFTFDVTSAHTHAWEDELVFFWNRHQRRLRNMVIVCGGRSEWQEHFESVLRSEEPRQRGFTVESHPKCATLYYVRDADGVIELHVDDGPGCGKETIIAELLTFLSEKIEMKYVQGIWCGSYEYLNTVKVRDGTKLTSVSNKKHLQSALKKLEMSECQTGQGVHRW